MNRSAGFQHGAIPTLQRAVPEAGAPQRGSWPRFTSHLGRCLLNMHQCEYRRTLRMLKESHASLLPLRSGVRATPCVRDTGMGMETKELPDGFPYLHSLVLKSAPRSGSAARRHARTLWINAGKKTNRR